MHDQSHVLFVLIISIGTATGSGNVSTQGTISRTYKPNRKVKYRRHIPHYVLHDGIDYDAITAFFRLLTFPCGSRKSSRHCLGDDRMQNLPIQLVFKRANL
jgi:hypothetical protein